jgi:hypothetical protein
MSVMDIFDDALGGAKMVDAVGRPFVEYSAYN